MDTLTKTEQALARIFAHCDAVASGEKPTPSAEDGKKMAAAFLGEVNVSDQIPRTRGVANTTDGSERLSASVLFAPCDGCVNVETCKTIGCIAKELEETI